MGDELTVRGGAGSIVAEYEDMLQVAGRLDGVGDELRSLSGAVAACAADGDIIAGGVLSQRTMVVATAQILDAATGPNGLLVLSVRLEANAVWVRATVQVHEAFDAAQAAALETMQDVVGFGLGVGVWGLAGAGLVTAAGVAGSAYTTTTALVVGRVLVRGGAEFYLIRRDLLSGRITWREALERLQELHPQQLSEQIAADLQVALPAVTDWLLEFGGQVGEGLGAAAQDTLFENPWIVDTLTGGAEGLLGGLTAPLLGGAGLLVPGWPPATYEDAVAALLAAGGAAGYFRDGSATATPIEATRNAALPTGIQGIFEGQEQVGQRLEGDGARVRVIEVTGPDGGRAWMVQIPGTQEWGPEAGGNPADVTTNLHLMAQNQTASMAAIESAMRQAGVPSGEPVMLTGHSQGGITAASLASSPGFTSRFNVTHVVTGGSPIARFDIPDDVQVLALEHHQDPVPRLEGQANPERSTWTTVTRDISADASDPGKAHAGTLYAGTGELVDGSTDASVEAFRRSAAPFLTGEGIVRDYGMVRQ